MTTGRPTTLLNGLDAATQSRIVEALKSSNRERPTALYRRFGLEQRGVKYGSFMKWCRGQRRKLAAAAESGDVRIALPEASASAIQPRAFDNLQRLLAMQQECLDAGDTKVLPSIAIAQKALIACMQLRFEEEAEKRAAELHQIKVTQLTKDLRSEVDARSENGNKTLTRAEVYDMIDAIARGQ